MFKYTDSILNQFKTLLNEINLNFLLFDNSPPNNIKLCKTNKLFIFALNETPNLFNLVQWYTAQLIIITESTHAELIIAQKKLKLIKEILNTWKKYMKSKKIALEEKFVFSTQKILDITQATEVEIKAKKKHKQPHKHTIDEILDEKKTETLKNKSSSSDSDCIVVAKRT